MAKKSKLLQLLRGLVKDNADLIMRYLLQQYHNDKLPEELRKIFEGFEGIEDIEGMDILTELELLLELLDNDFRNKQEVYQIIATFIEEKFDKQLSLCLGATHILCGESDPRLLKEGARDAEKLAEEAKKLILTIKVHYARLEKEDQLIYQRCTEIYYRKNNQPAVKKVEEELNWDSLPPDVRESEILEGQKRLTFQLYPQE